MFVGNSSTFLLFLFYFRISYSDNMSVQGFSTCRMQFIPNDQKHSERNYSDRSLIELRQYDFGDYSLRALDIEHNGEV